MVDVSVAILLTTVISLLTAIVTYSITKKRHYSKGKQDGITEYKSDRYRDDDFENKVKERLELFKNSEEQKINLQYHIKLGEEQGSKNELAKFKIEYEPFLNTKDEFLRKKAEIGFFMQLYYNGLPIGEPMKHITSCEEKFKEDNAKHLIDTVTQYLHSISSFATNSNIPISILTKVKRSEIK